MVYTPLFNQPESNGFIRIFVDEGPPLVRLLDEARRREIALDYVSRLLHGFPIESSEKIGLPDNQSSESAYIEPLSARGIQVIQLVAGGLINLMIAS